MNEIYTISKAELLKLLALIAVLFLLMNLIGRWCLKQGLKQYYCLYPADILIIGHSMSELSLERTTLEKGLGCSVAKYCMNGAGTSERLTMLKHYLEATGHKPRLVIYDVSGRSFSGGLAYNSYSLFYPFIGESPSCDKYVRRGASRTDYWQKKLIPLTRYDDTRLGAVIRGYLRDWQNHKLNHFNAQEFSRQIARGDFWKIGFDEDNIATFQATLEFLDTNGIHCLLLALPCVDMLNKAEPEKYAKAMAIVQDLAGQHPLATFADFNPELSNRYELFADPIHLNPLGQKVVTDKLIVWLLNNQ